MNGRPGELPLNINRRQILLPRMNLLEETIAEYEVQGFSAKHHPMQILRQQSSNDNLLTSSEIVGLPDNASVYTAGYVVIKQAPPTAKGMVFLTLEDEDGLINVIVKPQVYKRYRQVIKFEPLVVVDGKLRKGDGTASIVAQRFKALSQEIGVHLYG